MLISRGKRYEISSQLGPLAAERLAQWIGVFSVIWNCKVAEQKERVAQWAAQGRTSPFPKVDQAVAHFQSKERPWISKAPSQVRRNAGSKFFEATRASALGLRKPPRFRSRADKRSVLITNELFDASLGNGVLTIRLKSSAKAPFFGHIELSAPEGMREIPKQIWVSRRGRRFFLSFSYEVERDVEAAEVLRNRLALMPVERQAEQVVALDRGVVQPVALSTGKIVSRPGNEQAALTRIERRKRKYQKRMARQRKGSKNRAKTKQRFADVCAHEKHLRQNFAHHVSKEIAEKAPSCVVVEDLKIGNMTARPKARPIRSDEGHVVRYERNGAAAKAGLNRAILGAGWGLLVCYLSYKLAAQNKFLDKIAPHFSSQECLHCGYTHATNRPTRDRFHCGSCGAEADADVNAAQVLAKRYLKALNAGTLPPLGKPGRRISPRRSPGGKSTARTAGLDACGGTVRPTGPPPRVVPKAVPAKQDGSCREAWSEHAKACEGSSAR